MASIVRKEFGHPNDYGESLKLASLEPGDNRVIQDFNGRKNDVQIECLGLQDGDATIEVLVGSGVDDDDDNDGCQDQKTKGRRFETNMQILRQETEMRPDDSDRTGPGQLYLESL